MYDPDCLLLNRLPLEKHRKGSKARCHLMTHGSTIEVAARLTGLIHPWGHVDPSGYWVPQGCDAAEEAQLDKSTRLISDHATRMRLREWWLGHKAPALTTTPNWDIASTCTIEGAPGLLLVEAKAHRAELAHTACAAPQGSGSYTRIKEALKNAGDDLNRMTPGRIWRLSPDDHPDAAEYDYQIANRFAWAWKLTTMNIPVVLVYLGLLGAQEMNHPGTIPFSSAADWDRAIRSHGRPMIPEGIWNQKIESHSRLFIPLIQSKTIPIEPAECP